ncbi:MAG: lipocalin-like domain-containing protein [Candidatus Sulfotelmatobacter sp.]
MSGVLGMSPRRFIVVIAATVLAISAHAQSVEKRSSSSGAKEKLIGAWHLVHIDAPGSDRKPAPVPQPTGMLIYTRDGHMSVQLMYPESANTLSNEYVLSGYEASFGRYDIDEIAHTVTHHVKGSNTRGLLVGKDLPRKYEFTADGRLVVRSARADEHWAVTWEHY